MSINLTAPFPNHLSKFEIIPYMFQNTTSNKSNIYGRHWCKFARENFVLDYFSIEWMDILKINKLNVDNSTQINLEKINLFRYLSTSQKMISTT